MTIDTCVENFSGAVLKRRPRDDSRSPIPTGIKEELRLKTRFRRQWQVTRDSAPRIEINRLQRSVTRRLDEWRNDQRSATIESLNHEEQSL
jgi:hypothetical protein